jgi:hypothetical protein
LVRAGTFCHTRYLVPGRSRVRPTRARCSSTRCARRPAGQFHTAQAKLIFALPQRPTGRGRTGAPGRVVRAGTIGTGRAYRFVEEPKPCPSCLS